MTHYPPIGPAGQETEASRLLEKYRVDICVFGHLHNVKPGLQLFGKYRGVNYYLTACDYLEDFKPLKIYSSEAISS
jgi:predicted phosphohydrolase